MNNRRLSIALAAIFLGAQFGSPAVAALAERDLALVETYVLNGQVEELLALLAANPELLEIAGALGDTLRAFADDPSPATLAAVSQVSNGQIAVALQAAAAQSAISIY